MPVAGLPAVPRARLTADPRHGFLRAGTRTPARGMAPGTGRPAYGALQRNRRGLSPARRDPLRCSGPTLFHVFHALRARRTRAGFFGAPVQRWVVDDKARRGECRDALAFSPAQDVLSKSPATTHEPCGQDVRRARKRGVILFGYLSLGQARESSSRL